MSRSLRCLNSSLRSLNAATELSALPPRGTAARRYSVAAMRVRSEEKPRSAPQRIPRRHRQPLDEPEWHEGVEADSQEARPALETEEERIAEEESWNGPRSSWKEASPELAKYLNHLFPELHFPDELAKRILTHGSHPSAIYGHNAAYSFMGRRVLESYLLLMLNSSLALKSSHNVDETVARTLNSYTLGERVGSKWGLGRAIRWTPSVAAHQLKKEADQRELLRSVGLYKVQGDTVSAIVGGVFLQFGGSVAHRLFHTRVLPKLIHKGLPDTFSQDAQDACDRMGGPNGKLVVLDTPPLQKGVQQRLAQ